VYGQYQAAGAEAKGDIFYFDYGCVAMWGLSQKEVGFSSHCWILFFCSPKVGLLMEGRGGCKSTMFHSSVCREILATEILLEGT
jgi:hypothetical protein